MELKPYLPLVSIVTPSFNQVRYLEATIQSVLSQSYPRLEYIIVDGGSTDGSVEIIRKYESKLAWWVSEKDQGQTDAINKGFAHAKGDFFAWLNSDDTYKPNALSSAVKFLQDHPEVGLAYGDANYINEDGRVIGRFPAAQTDLIRLTAVMFTSRNKPRSFAPICGARSGRLILPFISRWIMICGFGWRARSQVKYVPQTWANFRLHTSGKTISADDRCWPEMLRVHYRDGGSFLSVIVAKYYIRKLIAPIWNWRLRRKLQA